MEGTSRESRDRTLFDRQKCPHQKVQFRTMASVSLLFPVGSQLQRCAWDRAEAQQAFPEEMKRSPTYFLLLQQRPRQVTLSMGLDFSQRWEAAGLLLNNQSQTHTQTLTPAHPVMSAHTPPSQFLWNGAHTIPLLCWTAPQSTICPWGRPGCKLDLRGPRAVFPYLQCFNSSKSILSFLMVTWLLCVHGHWNKGFKFLGRKHRPYKQVTPNIWQILYRSNSSQEITYVKCAC